MKKILTKLVYGSMNLNDLYGSFTAKRVKEFQKYYGITQTGKAGPRTLAQIDSLLPNPLSEGKRHKDTVALRSEEHTSELQSRGHLVCRLLLEKKKKKKEE